MKRDKIDSFGFANGKRIITAFKLRKAGLGLGVISLMVLCVSDYLTEKSSIWFVSQTKESADGVRSMFETVYDEVKKAKEEES